MKEKILLTAEEIEARVGQLAEQITEDFKNEEVILIPLLRGGFIFAADLCRKLPMPVVLDFITTSSYGSGKASSGEVKLIQDLREDITDKNVLIVDDICDSGHTLKSIRDLLHSRGPRSLKTCVILDKKERREVEITPDYIGFSIPDVFIVGYGLNYGRLHRNKPYIYTYIE